MMKKYPIGVQNFESLRRDNYSYVDKTDLVYRLASTGRYYFLSRPRRFGKSLLLSTLEAYFQGKRDLFKGLAIESLETEWTEYPVLHLDLNAQSYDSRQELINILNDTLDEWQKLYGSDTNETDVSLHFKGIIRSAFKRTGRRVVVLVDEYDKPVLQAMGNPALQKEYKDTLKAFYGVLKSMDGYIRFAMLTGVTKLVSDTVWGDLDFMCDISMLEHYYSVCGFTRKELVDCFSCEISNVVNEKDITYKDFFTFVDDKYGNYRFCHNMPCVYRPIDVMSVIKYKDFNTDKIHNEDYKWIIKKLHAADIGTSFLSKAFLEVDELDILFPIEKSPILFLFYMGLLRVRSYNELFNSYQLEFINNNIKDDFFNQLNNIAKA